MSRLQRAAIGYARAGWHVFPLWPRSKKPIRVGGFHNATNDVPQIQADWTAHQNANIGLAPGPSGFICVDIDGPEGENAAIELGLRAEPTLSSVTGRAEGGAHLFYKHPGFYVGNSVLADHLDVRGDAGYTVLPPSVHPTGRRYRWDPVTRDVLPLPPKAKATLEKMQGPESGSECLELSGLVEGLREGVRHNVLRSWIGHWVARGLSIDEVTAIALAVNGQYGKPPTEHAEVLKLVEWTAVQQTSQDGDRSKVLPLSEWKKKRGAA